MSPIEQKIKYLEMIQSVINRMAANSFALKGWSVTLISGISMFSGQAKPWKLLFTVGISFCFWCVDAYYLKQERLYRLLYNRVVSGDKSIDFSLDTSSLTLEDENPRCFTSRTEVLFYGGIIVFLLIPFLRDVFRWLIHLLFS